MPTDKVVRKTILHMPRLWPGGRNTYIHPDWWPPDLLPPPPPRVPSAPEQERHLGDGSGGEEGPASGGAEARWQRLGVVRRWRHSAKYRGDSQAGRTAASIRLNT